MLHIFSKSLCLVLLGAVLFSCTQEPDQTAAIKDKAKSAADTTCINPSSKASMLAQTASTSEGNSASASHGTDKVYEAKLDSSKWPAKPWPKGMIWIPAGTYKMGGIGEYIRKDELPIHTVKVDGFWMDQTEITIGQFKAFVKATKYVTTAEQKPDWEQIKLQLPEGTPKPDESIMVPGGLVFNPPSQAVPLNDHTIWWRWVPGASWKHPQGPNSDVFSTTKFDNHPVTQISFYDAVAYAKWTKKRIPTEAEWEYACRGGQDGKEFAWGDSFAEDEYSRANLWQGGFPYDNKELDGYYWTSPARAFPANGYGLFDMIGNVWEWTADWYRPDTYTKETNGNNPKGPKEAYDPTEPLVQKKVVRGGSFLCHQSYCASYRPSARMRTDTYSGENHTGFRTVISEKDWKKAQK